MKKHILTTLFLACIAGFSSNAQDVIRQVPCESESIMHQADSIKADFSNKGFKAV